MIRPTLLGVGPADARAADHRSRFRGVLGHQFVGVVEHVEPPAEQDLVGARVVGDPTIIPASAPLARKGLGQHAPERTVMGLHGRDGCFATRVCLPTRNLTRLPDDLPDESAILAEPLAAALHTQSLVRLETRVYVTVIGDNLPGLLCAQLMARRNAHVRLLGTRPDRFDLCDKWGVRHRPRSEVGAHADQDVVLDCTGEPDSIAMALTLVRPRGIVVVRAGALAVLGSPPSAAIDLGPVMLHEIEVLGARCGSIAEAVETLANGFRGEPLQTAGICAAPRPFDRVTEALAAADAGTEVKVVMSPP